MIGLQTGIVKLVPYTSKWRRLFDQEKARLQAAVGDYVLDTQHVGSTSIPAMAAKPIIDIGIAVQNFEKATICIKPIEKLGYKYKGEYGIPRRHYFVKGNPRTHHIHMVEVNSRDWETMLLFRDYLTQHSELAEEYVELKLKLAQQFPTNRQAYQDAKSQFIERVLQLAASGTG